MLPNVIIQSVSHLNIDYLHQDNCRIVLLGAGGHAKVLLDVLIASGVKVDGVVDPILAENGGFWRGIAVIGNDDELLKIGPAEIVLVNGIGSLPGKSLRQRLFAQFRTAGFRFISVVHPSALMGSGVVLGEGVQLMAGSIVQADSTIGDNSIVNTGALIDHDCVFGSHVHIAPGVVISGGVRVGNGAHIGTGVSIIQGMAIGAGAVIGAGTVVLKDIPDYHKLLGHPPEPATKMDLE
jgi:sugar O-acyltransferase (sialic acid O-acetyltransferase NeuD family)